MQRIDYARGVLDSVCRNFEKKYPNKIPYFVIYTIPVENERALYLLNRDRRRQGIINAMTQEEYQSEFKGTQVNESQIKSHKEMIPKINTGGGEGGSKGGHTPPTRGKIVQINPLKTVKTEKHMTWNYYDCLNPLYGEVHELDELPATSVVELKIEKTLVKNVELRKLYNKRVLDKTPQVSMIGFKKNKPLEEKTLDEIIAEVSEQDLIPEPFVFRSGKSEVLAENSTHIELGEHERLMNEMYETSCSMTRRQIECSLEMRGLSVVISKQNDVEIIGGADSIRNAIHVVEHALGIGDFAQDDGVSGDEFESDDEK